MIRRMSKKLITILLPAFALVTLTIPASADSHMKDESKDEPTATIEIKNWNVGFIVGYGGGKGKLHHDGKSYPLKISGLRVGAAVGIAKANLSGDVYNLTKPEDIEGDYSAGAASAAVIAGGKVWSLENDKGVLIKVKGTEKGLELALDISGMTIKLDE